MMIFVAMLVCFIQGFFIDRDSNKLLIGPMKDMMRKIKRIQKNPVYASKKAEEEQF